MTSYSRKTAKRILSHPERDVRLLKARDWEALRNRILDSHPLCQPCKEKGLTVGAQAVHHIIPIFKGGDDSIENLMPICNECHDAIHQPDKRGGPRLYVRGCNADGTPHFRRNNTKFSTKLKK